MNGKIFEIAYVAGLKNKMITQNSAPQSEVSKASKILTLNITGAGMYMENHKLLSGCTLPAAHEMHSQS